VWFGSAVQHGGQANAFSLLPPHTFHAGGSVRVSGVQATGEGQPEVLSLGGGEAESGILVSAPLGFIQLR
jgi:hypothetical protein